MKLKGNKAYQLIINAGLSIRAAARILKLPVATTKANINTICKGLELLLPPKGRETKHTISSLASELH